MPKMSWREPETISEPPRTTPIAFEADLCVVGGSCTGVFAAVRAARLGLSVALVEKCSIFGGMATAALVNEWHSLRDAFDEKDIIAGLTAETIQRLHKRNAIFVTKQGADRRYRLNSAELALELDDYVRGHGIRAFLESRCAGAVTTGKKVKAIITEDRSGRRAICARIFIDASGDGDLLCHAGFPRWKNPAPQPMSLQALIAGLGPEKRDIWEQVKDLAAEYSYPLENGTPWFSAFPSPGDITNIFGARMHDFDGSDADEMTEALMEGRRRQRAMLDMIRKRVAPKAAYVAVAQGMGVRETWHAHGMHRLLGTELLEGKSFPDAIACGTYPVDVHSENGTQLRYMDGREVLIDRDGSRTNRRWRDENEVSRPFYQVPLASIIPTGSENLLVAGRLIDADRDAFGAVRVMVNMNQTGEAAGVAAALALQAGKAVCDFPPEKVRSSLIAGGSNLPPSFESPEGQPLSAGGVAGDSRD